MKIYIVKNNDDPKAGRLFLKDPFLKKVMIKSYLTSIFLMILFLQTGFASYGQKVTIAGNNLSLVQVLSDLKKQSNYTFVYKSAILKNTKPIAINLKNVEFDQALEEILQTQGFSFEKKENTIVIYEVTKNSTHVNSSKTSNQNQELTVRGRVFDTNEPPTSLPGVSIMIKGTSRGVTTDIDGYYTINVPKGSVLQFSMVGFITSEQTVNRDYTNLSVSLAEDVSSLEEVVIMGMTELQRKHIASSVSSLNVESNIAGKPITSLSQSLQGGVTGIQVSQGSGIPGGDAAIIKIRGITTLNNSTPLVLVDGIPMDMDHIDPVTVESVTVLKDAAAAAIYGARAANGVILITTKRGVPGRISVTYDAYGGIATPSNVPDFVDAPTYMRMHNYANVAIGGQASYTEEDIERTASGSDPINYPNTDWKKEVIQEIAPLHSHSLAVSGGNEVARFAVTGNYINQQGMLPVNKMDRYNLRANTSISLGSKFLVYLDVLAIKRNTTYPNRPNNHDGNRILDDMYRLPPTVLPKYPAVDGYPQIYGRYADIVNPVAYAEEGGSIGYEYAQNSVNLQPKWEVFPNFNLRGQLSFRLNSDVYKQQRDNYFFFDYYTNQLVQTWDVQRNSYSETRDTYYYLAGSGDYTLKKNQHNLFALAGYSMESFHNGYWNVSSILSGYSKFNYSFDDRYLLEASMRIDGSSKFGPGQKYGYFPAVAAGWNLHNENFFNADFVSNLKLRASYGQLGNEGIGLYQYQNLINTSNGLESVWGNPNITWEKVNLMDLGLDLGLWDNKLEVVFDYYNKITNDIILKPTVSLVDAIGRAPINAGKVRNKGWELSVNYTDQLSKDFNFGIKPGISYNDNKILSLKGGPFVSGMQVNEVGYSINSYKGYKTDGILQANDFETDGITPKFPAVKGQGPGDIKYVDINGDGIINDEDQYIMGNGVPKINFFSNFNFRYKKLDFEFLLQGTGKADYSANINGKSSGYLWHPLNFSASGGVPTTYRAANTWRPNNLDAKYPRILATPTVNVLTSDFWLFNSSYMRVKYVQLGYRFDGEFLRQKGIQSARLYVNAQNPFTFTEVDMVDPESQGGSWTYGLMKTFTAGVRINF